MKSEYSQIKPVYSDNDNTIPPSAYTKALS